MYGTIMRGKVKAGRKDDFVAFMNQLVPSADDYGRGLHSIEVGWEDKDPDRFVVIVHFKDRESYIANADRADTNTDYEKQLEYLEGPPEWIDVTYADYVGKPIAEGAATA